MDSVELEEGVDTRCTLYGLFAYEDSYLSIPRMATLPDEEKRKQREQDKEDFLAWLWLSPLAGGLAGDNGLDELDRLREFAISNRLDGGQSRHDYKKLEEAIREAVEDDVLIPVLDRTEDWGGGSMPAASPESSLPINDLLHASDDAFTPIPKTFSGGDPILSGPYDRAMQEAKLKGARADMGGIGDSHEGDGGSFDWLGAAEAVAGAALGRMSLEDDSGDSLLKSFGDTGEDGGLFSKAQPFEYQPSDLGNDMQMAWLPSTDGPPNSWLENPSGKKQWRYYDENGNAAVDIDFGHDHGFGAPHSHNWENGKRDKGNPVSIF